ncbi:MAG TPA: sugar ABC transporter substrate-binding protein [Ktedonobacteraceae bacterium]|nr:sugar ABC transporter substrate-binding protein [Ktedonobacteraceae bacterium]
MSFSTWHRRLDIARHDSHIEGSWHRFSSRSWALVSMGLAIMMIAVGLAACGGSGSGSSSSSSNGPVNLTYALWDQNEQVGYQQSVNQFMKLHPNIKVTIQQTPWASYWQKLSTEFAAGNAPDVFWDHLAYYPQFVQQGQLMNLSPLISQNKIDMSQYYSQLVKEWSYNGGVYGLPKDWDTIAVLYNKQMFQKAGLPTPTSMTWNPTDGGTFLQIAQKLTVDQNGKHPTDAGFDAAHIKQYGYVSENNAQEGFWNFIAMNGGTLIDKQFGQNFQLAQPTSQQALQSMVDLILKYHVSPSATETNNNSSVAEQLFEGGHVAMITAGDWELSAITQQTKIPWGVVQLPAGPKGVVSVFNGLTDAIYAKTQHPQEAWELEQWLGSQQSQHILGSGGFVWPAIKSEDQTFADSWQKKGIDVSPYLKEAQGTTIGFPVTFGYNEASTDINNIFNQMYLGQLPVAQATTQAVQQANQAAQSASAGS